MALLLLAQAKAAATAFHTLKDRVAADADYLEATLAAAAQYDDFTARACTLFAIIFTGSATRNAFCCSAHTNLSAVLPTADPMIFHTLIGAMSCL